MQNNPQISRIARDVAHLGGYCHWLLFRVLPALLLISLSLLLLSVPRAHALDHPAGVDPTEPESGYLLLEKDDGSQIPAVLHGSRVHFQISGMIAKVVLEQRFHNDSKAWVEGVYSFPLPENAAVRYLEVLLGERRIVGKIREREEAFIKRAIRSWGSDPNIEILGDRTPERLSIVSFVLRSGDRYLHHNYVVALLNDLFGIQSRAGCSCAGPYGHRLLDIDRDTSERYRHVVQEAEALR